MYPVNLSTVIKILFCSLVMLIITIRVVTAQTANRNIKKISAFDRADSLFIAHEWQKAVQAYKDAGIDTSLNSLEWNRLGFSRFNAGDIPGALAAYKRSLQFLPPLPLKSIILVRMARAYAVQKKYDEAMLQLTEAVKAGYANPDELDSLEEFNAMRNRTDFADAGNKIRNTAYPCSIEPHAGDFDFWVGEWIVYATGTNNLAGHSVIQKAAGNCMILENWTSANASYNGKSINYYEPTTGKWEQVWVGSEGGPNRVQHFYNGVYTDSAMRFEFTVKDSAGIKQPGRFIFYNEGKNRVRQFNETSPDGGKTWQTVYDFTYFRKKEQGR